MKHLCKAFLLAALTLLTFTQTTIAQNALTTFSFANQGEIEAEKYTILNNRFGDPDAGQVVWRWEGPDTWGWGTWFDKQASDRVTVNAPAAVLGWHWWPPRAETQLPARIWLNDPVMAQADWTFDNDEPRTLNVAYHLWFHDEEQVNDGLDSKDTPKAKIVVWLHQEGNISPQGTLQRTVLVQEREWELWRLPPGSGWEVFTFRPTDGSVVNTELRLRDFIHEIVYEREWMGNDRFLSGVEFGCEVIEAPPTVFQVKDNFRIDVAPDVEPQPAAAPADTMYVSGRHLYSATGEKVILRGVNAGLGWIEPERHEEAIKEISKSGVNCLRIVWLRPGEDFHPTTIADLDNVIRLTIENDMIPIIMMVSATGQPLSEVTRLVDDFWTRDDVVEIINKYQKWVVLNIANEAGDPANGGETDDDFVNVYTDAINEIRNAGIKVPLVIDATSFGQMYEQVFRTWEQLRDSDEDHHNLMFSLHTYWQGTLAEKRGIYERIIARVVADDIPLIFGEGPTPTDFQCQNSPWEFGLQKMHENDIGWLAWSWGVIRNRDCGAGDPNNQGANQFDITRPGAKNGDWNTDYGRILMVDSDYSVRNTSIRPDGLR